MERHRYFIRLCIAFFGLLLGFGCTSTKKQEAAGLPRIPFKNYLDSNDKISIGTDEIDSIEYIPLELTDDNASLVGYIQGIALTDEYMFILSFEDYKVFQFDRKGKYIRTITRQGQGPGELQTPGLTIWTDDEQRKVYISELENILIFSYDGTFERKISRNGRYVAYAGGKGVDWVAETYRDLFPMDYEEYFGIGAFRYNEDGSCDTLYMKKDIGNLSPLPLAETNFVMGVFFEGTGRYRYSVGCNDTLFTFTEKGVEPYLVFDYSPRSEEEKKYYFSFHQKCHPDMIFIQCACETPSHIYFRFSHNETFYVMSYEKETRKILCRKTDITFQNSQDYDGCGTHPGIENEVNGALPIWFRYFDSKRNIAVQPTSAATIAWMKEEGAIKNIPDFLQDYPADANPVVAVYHFKKTD